MALDLVAALPEYGGFNRMEKEEYFRLFIAGQDDTVKMLTLASEIAEAKGWALQETLERLQGLEKSPTGSGVLELAEFLPRFLEFQEIKKQAKLFDGVRLSRLMLLSRLPVSWFTTNVDGLTEFGIEVDVDALQGIPRKEWLTNSVRADAIDQLCDLLPPKFLRPVEDFAINELHEGKPSTAAVEDRSETPLSMPGESLQKPSKPTGKSGNSGMSATSESSPAA